jgi:protein TonB
MKKVLIILIGFFCIKNSFSQDELQVIKVRKEIKIDSIYCIAGVMPEFKGGDSHLYKFLGKNISYPDSLKLKGVTGKVYCKFVVEKDGSISNVEIIRSPNSAFSEIVKNTILRMPNWKPGMSEEKKVRVQCVVPVSFNLR